MLARLTTNLVILGSLAVLGAVGYYFYTEFQELTFRSRVLADLRATVEEEGPCAALERARQLERPLDFDLSRAVATMRRIYAGEVVGTSDARGAEALLDADAEGLVDRTMCEQMKLVRELGESHPILELLRYTRQGGDACEDPRGLDNVLTSLTSHRVRMLKTLMRDIPSLACLPSWLATKIAERVLAATSDEPEIMDDLELLRVARFVETWAPVESAQFACWVQATERTSRLATTIGCTPYHRKQVLPRYRYAKPFPAVGDAPEVEAGGEVLLLRRDGDRCEVRPVDDPPRAAVVRCAEMRLLSEVDVAVLIEPLQYGMARASLIAGVANFDGTKDALTAGSEEPEARSWYGYDRLGVPLGMAQEARLAELTARFGEDLPDNPLRTYCRKVGARYCYDVDWTQVVEELEGGPVIFLSRPMQLLLQPEELGREAERELLVQAFGGGLPTTATRRVYPLAGGGHLIAVVDAAGVDLRWRVGPGGTWSAQAFGAASGGSTPPTARLLAVLDLRSDGRPELLVQEVQRKRGPEGPVDVLDAITLLRLNRAGERFESLNRLTIHEY